MKTQKCVLKLSSTPIKSGKQWGFEQQPVSGKKFQQNCSRERSPGRAERINTLVHCLETQNPAAFFGSRFVSSVLFQETYIFFFVHCVDLLQLLLTAVDSVK